MRFHANPHDDIVVMLTIWNQLDWSGVYGVKFNGGRDRNQNFLVRTGIELN